ncbi:MAG: GGDEF domain-containing protein [Ruminococcus sp.]|nr:GGDEF domain-containing protein [Ruminococcus sp.]
MTISGYLSEHWGLLVVLAGMAILLFSDKQLDRRMTSQILITNIMQFLYSITCYMETYLGNQEEFTILRSILSAANYSLIGFVLVSIIMIMFPNQKKMLYIPAVVNAVLSFISIPTGIVFYFTEDNHFQRGPLGLLSYFINGLYLLYLLICLFRQQKYEREDYLVLLFVVLTSIMCMIMPLKLQSFSDHWFNITIATDVLIYYVFLLQQFTKRDSLTRLLNRQSYYSDSQKYLSSITSVVAIDMDGLKEINDNEGHLAGDKALKTLADCFGRAAQRGHRVYRIGGDEYVILCIGSSESDVQALIKRIRDEVAKTAYTCSVGYAMNTDKSTIDALYNRADEMLYEEKQQFYERTGKLRRRH